MSRTRVLVVDDSALMRKIVSDIVLSDPELELVGTAGNGSLALQKIPQLNPDVITLDIEMPEMDGLTAVKLIHAKYPAIKVIMCSTLTARGAEETLEALARGAVDYVTKPSKSSSIQESNGRLSEDLLPKIKAHGRRALTSAHKSVEPVIRRPAGSPALAKSTSLKVVCIGSSTGGPNALADVFSSFKRPFGLPIVMVQHMPPVFTAMLAQRLNKLNCGVIFHEGAEDMPVEPGHAYIAPGGRHMEVRKKRGQMVVHLHDAPPESSCRPAVDVLFRSVAEEFGGHALAVILTGMGADGCRGCDQLGSLGARVLAQDEKSSVVWGMPGAVARAGLADEILPLPQIGTKIQDIVQRHGLLPLRSRAA